MEIRFKPGEWPFAEPENVITVQPSRPSDEFTLRRDAKSETETPAAYHHYEIVGWHVSDKTRPANRRRRPQGPAVVTDD